MQLDKLPRMIVVKHAPQAKPVGAKRTIQRGFGVSGRVERIPFWGIVLWKVICLEFVLFLAAAFLAPMLPFKHVKSSLFKLQGQSLSGHAVCLYNLFVHHTLP